MNQFWILSLLVMSLLYDSAVESKKGFGPGAQDWGYVTVRKRIHMFWWLYYVNPPMRPSNFNVFTKPLIIWLQGGPGSSSTGIGNFEEIGPLDQNLQRRNHTWVHDYNVLFIDSPAGSGFSYVEPEQGYTSYAGTNSQVALDLFACIDAFLGKLKGFEKVPTYIVGQSYGGKNAVELAKLWHQHQQLGSVKSNLRGVALGDAWISPITSIRSWAPYLLHTGMIDTSAFDIIQNMARKILKFVQDNKWIKAKKLMDFALDRVNRFTDNANVQNILEEILSVQDSVNVNSSDLYYPTKNYKILENLMNSKVKRVLGIKGNWTIISWDVYNSLIRDFLMPVTSIVEYLLNAAGLRVLVYNGQLDMIVPVRGTLTWVEKLKWKYASQWRRAPRISFGANGIVQGYIKRYENLMMYWVNRAGHIVPKDNPYATRAILQDLTAAN